MSAAPTTMPQFAFANLKGNICLVQVTEPASALMASDIRVFRHEFITIFRYSHSTSVHPADLRVLEHIDERGTMYEEEKGTVFLSRDVMDRMQKLTAAAACQAQGVRHAHHPHHHPHLHPRRLAVH